MMMFSWSYYNVLISCCSSMQKEEGEGGRGIVDVPHLSTA